MRRTIAILTFAGALLFASNVSAQAFNPLANTLNLTMEPTYPAPNTTVYFSVQSSAIDLPESMIVWKAGGITIAEGVGITDFQTTAGSLGSNRLITVEVAGAEGNARAEARIAPTEVDLLWESDSYVPPFYRGRALAGTQSQIRLQTLPRFQLPNGTRIADKDIVYEWYRNGALVASASGRGKSFAVLQGPYLFGKDSIIVRARSGSLVGEASVQIPAHDTPLSLYENHPLLGVLYHRSLEGPVSTMETEQVVTAVPYFADIDRPSSGVLSYEWMVNGSYIEPDPSAPETLKITTVENYSGPATIELTVMNAADIVMRSTGKWELLFGTTNFFDAINPFGN